MEAQTDETDARRTWYHTIELPDGTVTPGYFDTRVGPAFVPWPSELRGGRCLDIGTYDGFWAFEMERRGAAEVIAVDLDDPHQFEWPYDLREWGPKAVEEWGARPGRGFYEAAERSGSKVKRVPKSVYDLNPDQDGMFDVVFCGSLLLHLRDPIRAMEAMRTVCRGKVVLAESIDPVLETVSKWLPAARVRPERDEWWRPNSNAMCSWLDTAGFTVVSRSKRFAYPLGPGGPKDLKLSFLSGLWAGKPGSRGVLHRVFVAEPRPSRGRPLR